MTKASWWSYIAPIKQKLNVMRIKVRFDLGKYRRTEKEWYIETELSDLSSEHFNEACEIIRDQYNINPFYVEFIDESGKWEKVIWKRY